MSTFWFLLGLSFKWCQGEEQQKMYPEARKAYLANNGCKVGGGCKYPWLDVGHTFVHQRRVPKVIV